MINFEFSLNFSPSSHIKTPLCTSVRIESVARAVSLRNARPEGTADTIAVAATLGHRHGTTAGVADRLYSPRFQYPEPIERSSSQRRTKRASGEGDGRRTNGSLPAAQAVQ